MRKLLVVCLTLTVLWLGVISHNKLTAASNAQHDLNAVHGKDNPGAIPDYIAQDAFLRSLTARPDDEGGKHRAETFAEDALGIEKGKQKTDQDKVDVQELLAAANRYVNQVSVMDVQVKEIKDQHFPEPSAAVMAELDRLQRRKVAIGQEVLAAFDKSSKVKKEKKEKVLRHIAEDVKRGITTVIPEKPGNPKHHNHDGMNHGATGLGMMLGMFFAPLLPAQSGYMGEGYTYSRTSYNLNWLEIYGYGSTAESYSSYGHTYKLTIRTTLDDGYSVTLNQPNGYSSSPPVSGTNLIPIFRSGIYFSGFSSTSTNGTGYCPMSYSYPYGMSSSYGSATIAPFLVLSPFGTWDRGTVGVSGTNSASINITVTPSRSNMPAGASAELELGHAPQSSVSVDMDIKLFNGESNQGSTLTGLSTPVTYTARYDPLSITADEADVRAVATLTGTGITVIGSPQTSAGSLRVLR